MKVTVWTLAVPLDADNVQLYEVLTSSARVALERVERSTGLKPEIVSLRQERAARPASKRDKVRERLAPKARSLRANGVSITEIAHRLKIARKTVSDWLRRGITAMEPR